MVLSGEDEVEEEDGCKCECDACEEDLDGEGLYKRGTEVEDGIVCIRVVLRGCHGGEQDKTCAPAHLRHRVLCQIPWRNFAWLRTFNQYPMTNTKACSPSRGWSRHGPRRKLVHIIKDYESKCQELKTAFLEQI